MFLEQDLSLMFDLAETAREVVDCVKTAFVGTMPLQLGSHRLLSKVNEALLSGVDGELVVNRTEVCGVP